MGHPLSISLAVATFLALAQARADDPATDQKAIQGTWDVSEFILDGKPRPEDVTRGLKFVFIGDTMKLVGPVGIGEHAYKFTLDPTKTPKAIDVVPQDGPSEGKSGPAISELTGDTLKLCIPNNETKDRPTEFKSPEEVEPGGCSP